MSDNELDRINKVIVYARKNEKAVFYKTLVSTGSLLKYFYGPLKRRPVAARVSEAIRKPVVDKGKRKVSETKYFKDRAFLRIEDEVKNPQISSLKRRRSDRPEASSRVKNVFASVMSAT